MVVCPVIPAFRRWRQVDQEIKVILHYTSTLRPGQATGNPLLKQRKKFLQFKDKRQPNPIKKQAKKVCMQSSIHVYFQLLEMLDQEDRLSPGFKGKPDNTVRHTHTKT